MRSSFWCGTASKAASARGLDGSGIIDGLTGDGAGLAGQIQSDVPNLRNRPAVAENRAISVP